MDPERPTVLLDHYLKLLKLPTIKREYKTVAAACAKLGHDAIEFAARDRKLEAARAERKVRRQAARTLARLGEEVLERIPCTLQYAMAN